MFEFYIISGLRQAHLFIHNAIICYIYGMTTAQAINKVLAKLGKHGFEAISIKAPTATGALKTLLDSTDRQIEYSNIARELKRQELVEITVSATLVSLSLTPAGAHRLQNAAINKLTVPRPVKWDRKWRLLAFDVPLEKSRQRQQFTKRLNQLGFYCLQRSLWFYPYPCYEQLEQLASHYNIWRYCAYMEIDNLDNLSADKLERRFF